MSGQTGNASRGLVMGGNFNGSPWTQFQTHIGMFNISTFADGTFFGDLSQTKGYGMQCCSSTRSVYMGGYVTPAKVDVIEYVQNATTGNAQDFCNLTSARSAGTGTSNGHGGLSN